MRKNTFIAILLIMLSILVACEKKQEESKVKELIFLEKNDDYVKPSFVFESLIDKKYYLVEVSNWEYDNAAYKNGDLVELDSIKSKEVNPISKLFFYTVFYTENVTLPDEEVFILDDWRPLFILNGYRKEDLAQTASNVGEAIEPEMQL